jgi:hypothetical protein
VLALAIAVWRFGLAQLNSDLFSPGALLALLGLGLLTAATILGFCWI